MMLATDRNYFFDSIKWLAFVSDMLFSVRYKLNIWRRLASLIH